MSYFGVPPSRQRDAITRVEYTAGAGQTVFAISGSPPYVNVYQNGSKLSLAGGEYTYDGTNVTLTTGATLGDNIALDATKSSNPNDVYTKAQADALAGVFYAVAPGTVDALAVTTTPLIPTLANGVEVRLRVSGPNTSTAPTVTFSNLGVAKTITMQGNQPIPAGAWATNQEITLRYNVSTDKLEWLGVASFATSAEVLAGTVGNKVVTPAGILAQWTGSNQSKTTNGYQKLPGGLIIQWGIAASTTIGVVVTFPIPFPTACFSVTSTGVQNQAVQASTFSTTQFYSATAGSNFNVSWMAIGH